MFVFSDQESNCFKIVKMILERKFAPVIVFSFSKKDCEAYAMQMTKLDFNTGTSPFSTEPTNLQGCGNTMPDLSDLVPFHSGQVENFYLLVLGQVQMY